MPHDRVVVVGAGNAGLCAALAAADQGADVTILERAPFAERGGNSAYTAGSMRVAYHGAEDLLRLMPKAPRSLIDRTSFGAYSEASFFEDLARATEYRCDPDLADILVMRSYDTLRWMAERGVDFYPNYGRQAVEVDGEFRFWGSLPVEVGGGGPGLVDGLFRAVESRGADVRYRARALELLRSDRGVEGVRIKQDSRTVELKGTVVLAAGGFQANPEWRSRYLGPDWDLAKVRGTRFNTGDGIRMALEAGASPYGHWSGCHAVAWDRNAPEFGDLTMGSIFQKHSYPFGVIVNARGERFVDEGADFRNHTYAKYGREILHQPHQLAWQVFDAKTRDLLRGEYRVREMTSVQSDSLEGLAEQLEGVDPVGFLAEIEAFNRAVRRDIPFDPNIKDGRRTEGLAVDKSNWATTIDQPPFQAFATTCGITFTFGGLRLNDDAQVIDTEGEPIPGLYAAGELVGGLFYFNVPAGTGLTSGAVFGRTAGTAAGNGVMRGLQR